MAASFEHECDHCFHALCICLKPFKAPAAAGTKDFSIPTVTLGFPGHRRPSLLYRLHGTTPVLTGAACSSRFCGPCLPKETKLLEGGRQSSIPLCIWRHTRWVLNLLTCDLRFTRSFTLQVVTETRQAHRSALGPGGEAPQSLGRRLHAASTPAGGCHTPQANGPLRGDPLTAPLLEPLVLSLSCFKDLRKYLRK